MKKIEPTKNVTPIASRGLEAHCAATAATKKQVDPTANSTAIHHPRFRGRHQTGSRSRSRGWPERASGAPCGERASASAPRCRRARAEPRLSRTAPGHRAETRSHPSGTAR